MSSRECAEAFQSSRTSPRVSPAEVRSVIEYDVVNASTSFRRISNVYAIISLYAPVNFEDMRYCLFVCWVAYSVTRCGLRLRRQSATLCCSSPLPIVSCQLFVVKSHRQSQHFHTTKSNSSLPLGMPHQRKEKKNLASKRNHGLIRQSASSLLSKHSGASEA
jgi:hypothetical protein